MKFFCDENLPKILISHLKNISGAKVKSIASEKAFGLSDEEISRLAIKNKSIVVTFDKDFLAIDDPNLKIIYLRFPKTDPQDVIPYLDSAIKLIPSAEKKKNGYVLHVTKEFISVIPHGAAQGKK